MSVSRRVRTIGLEGHVADGAGGLARASVVLTIATLIVNLLSWSSPSLAMAGAGATVATSPTELDSRLPIVQSAAATVASPAPRNTTQPLAASREHVYSVGSDGNVWTWGNQATGAPGDGTNTGGTSTAGPTPSRTSGFGSVASLAAAEYHQLALRPDGSVWAWGDDQYGTVGAGGAGDTNCVSGMSWPCALVPIQVPLSSAVAVAAADYDSYALAADGTVWAWGDNRRGQLGIGTNDGPQSCFVSFGADQWCSRTPVHVTGLSGVTSIAAGADFAMALRGDGTVWTWGGGVNGAAGSLVPVQISGLSGVIAIAATRNENATTAIALRADGTVWAWGRGSEGQLGNGAFVDSPTPVQVSSLTGVVAIAAGWSHVLSLKGDGTVWAWGDNASGDLGNSSTRSKSTPVQSGTLTGVVSISAGLADSFAAKSDGTVWSWGINTYGQLGDGTTTTRTSPVLSQMTGVPAPTPFVLLQQPLTGGGITASETLGGNNPCFPCVLDRLAQSLVGKPVNTAFGNMTDSTDDLAIPGRGFSLRFGRTYNSMSGGTDGPLGYGWTSNVLMSLSQPGGTGPVTIVQEGGSQAVFNQVGSTFSPAAPRLVASLTHNADGTWTFVRGGNETFVFSAAGLLSTERDLNGYATSFTYNGSGQLSSITDESGRFLTIGWTGSHITSVTDSNASPSRSVAFGYNDGAGNLTDVIDVNGGHSHYAYDVSHRLTNLYDPVCFAAGSSCNAGNGTVTVFDPAGRVSSQTDNLGRTTTFVFSGDPTSAAGSTTTITDPKGNVRREAYQYGVRIAVTSGYGTAQASTWQYRYDANTGGLIGVTDPNMYTTSYTVDSSGNWLSRTDPLGRVTRRTYNALNELLTETDPLGVATTYTYDARGNLTQVSRPLLDGSGNVIATRSTLYAYGDPAHPGDRTSETDPAGKVSTYTYDPHGFLASMADPMGHTSTWIYNADGWLLTSVSPRGNVAGCNCASQFTTSYGYVDTLTSLFNGFGDPATVTDPLGNVTASHYDANRNLTSMTDPDNNSTSYVYDLENERTQVVRPGGSILRTDYNADGTVLAERDGKNNALLTFGYDALARVTTRTDALGNVTTFTYDGAGNPLTQQDPGGNCSASPVTSCITRSYDAANELASITYSDGTTPNVSSITYDGDGRRVGMTDGTGTSSWAWDSLGRLTSFTDGNADQVGYQYDLRGLVSGITYPGSLTVTRGYDDGGRWTSVVDWLGNATTFGYDADGHLTSRTLPVAAGIVDTATYNASGELTSISDTRGATSIFTAAYGRDGLGQVTSDSSLPASVGSYRYTGLNQLCYAGSASTNACSSPPSGSQAYAFDAADNLTSDRGTTQAFNAADQVCWTVSGASANACANPPTGATRYAYDTRGNRTTVTPSVGNATTTTYDLADRLVGWTQGSASASYVYNGDGLRMSKTVSGSTTRFTWDVSASLPFVISDGATNYVYGPGGQLLEQLGSSPGITHVGTASASGKVLSLALTLPTGTLPGDEVFLASTQPSTTTVTAPAGYSQVTSVTSGGSSPLARTTVYRHTVGTGETTVTLTYSVKTTTQAAVLAVYRGVDVAAPVDVFSSGSAAGTTTVTGPSITTASAGEQLVAFHGAVGSFTSTPAWTPPAGMTERRQVNPGSTAAGFADQSLTAAGATGTRVSSFGASGNLTTVLLGIPVRPTLFAHEDQIGTVRVLTDATGAVRGTFAFDPYGNSTASTGDWTSPFGFSGEYRDAESGLVFLRARYYDPATGVFISQDPVASSTRQPYTYASGNPANLTDPSGKCLWCVLGAVVGGIAGLAGYTVSSVFTGTTWDLGQAGIASVAGGAAGAACATTLVACLSVSTIASEVQYQLSPGDKSLAGYVIAGGGGLIGGRVGFSPAPVTVYGSSLLLRQTLVARLTEGVLSTLGAGFRSFVASSATSWGEYSAGPTGTGLSRCLE